MSKLSPSFRGNLRLFAFFLVNRTLCDKILEDVDYDDLFEEPGPFEQVFAIFANVVELDGDGSVVNADVACRRAAQYIRKYINDEYVVDSPFQDWELELHRP